MFNIAITSMEIWQRSRGTGSEYVLVHLAWYPKGRYCATSAGNTPMHLSTLICLERYPGTPGFVPYSARKTGDHHIDFPAMRAGTTDTCSAAIEGEGNCLVRVQFVGDFLPSFIDLVSATWVLYKMAYAYDLLKYPSFWYADGLMDLMMTLEGVKCEAEVVKGNERVYRNLQKGLQEDIRKNGFRSEQTDEEQEKSSGGVWAVGEWLWTWLEAMFSSDSEDTIDIPFPIDKRSDAVALKDARKSIEHQATLICGILEGDVDRRTGRIHYHSAGPFRSWNREILQREVPPDPAPESDHLGEVD
ncbi:hypothetical protein BDN72DRAFT_686588 [Pluteus cervinus]|uniref:Uncharacterized protein n=1 Tax=Pluteus cervinus TaxID=181527 RepID=A0ACD3AR05_9AGAR|nr:hypothetical protein BDN72DRAFT_686588 [Pluteus cervinus]